MPAKVSGGQGLGGSGEPCIAIISFGPVDMKLLHYVELVTGTPAYLAALKEPLGLRPAGETTLSADKLKAAEEELRTTGEPLGEQMVTDGPLAEADKSIVWDPFIGKLRHSVCAIVVLRDPTKTLTDDQRTLRDVFVNALVKGIRTVAIDPDPQPIPVVLAERDTTKPSSVQWADDRKLDTVDDLERSVGRTALALVLRGAKGNYGTKKTADSLLPTEIRGVPLQTSPTAAETSSAGPASLSAGSLVLLLAMLLIAAPALHFGVRRLIRTRR
jgi:hypothetical protein